jgi:hypothetical protein
MESLFTAVETEPETVLSDLPTGIVGHLRWRRITANGISNIQAKIYECTAKPS